MSVKVNETIKEINKNAREHGWWEDDRPFYEIIALIHSELSEALEEYRCHRAMVWYSDDPEHKDKPEGIAVELIDAVIRIFDFVGQLDDYVDGDTTIADMIGLCEKKEDNITVLDKMNCPAIVAEMHLMVSKAFDAETLRNSTAILLGAAFGILTWVKRQGLDAEAIMLEKHEYNKTRPYRHGNKVC